MAAAVIFAVGHLWGADSVRLPALRGHAANICGHYRPKKRRGLAARRALQNVVCATTHGGQTAPALPCVAMLRMLAGAVSRKSEWASSGGAGKALETAAGRGFERPLKRRGRAFQEEWSCKFSSLADLSAESRRFSSLDGIANPPVHESFPLYSPAWRANYSCGASPPASSVCKSARSASLAFGPTAAPTQLGQPPSQGHSSSRSSAS